MYSSPGRCREYTENTMFSVREYSKYICGRPQNKKSSRRCYVHRI